MKGRELVVGKTATQNMSKDTLNTKGKGYLSVYTKIYKKKRGVFYPIFFLGIYGFRSYVQIFNIFELIFVYGERQVSSFIRLGVDIQFSQHYFLKRLFFPLCILGTFNKDHLTYIRVSLFLGSEHTLFLTHTQT